METLREYEREGYRGSHPEEKIREATQQRVLNFISFPLLESV